MAVGWADRALKGTLLFLYLATFAPIVSADCIDVISNSDFPDSGSTINSQGTITAWYDGATDKYQHGVLGDAIEPSILRIGIDKNCHIQVVLDDDHVFEDIAPRLAAIDNNPGPEIVTVRSHRNKGAQLAVYQIKDDTLSLLATTPYIGTANRWLAPIGIADFNDDGHQDIAIVDRPHLAKQLVVWSYINGKLEQVARKGGYSNHRIGEVFISGGVRNCSGIPEMITADSRWQRVLATQFKNGKLTSKDIGAFEGTRSFDKALECE